MIVVFDFLPMGNVVVGRFWFISCLQERFYSVSVGIVDVTRNLPAEALRSFLGLRAIASTGVLGLLFRMLL